MSKKTSDMRTQSSNPLAGKNELANLQRDNSGSNAGKSAVNIMAQKLAKQNAQVEPQLFDAKARTIAGVPFTDWSLDVPESINESQFNKLADVLMALEGRLQIYIGDMLNAVDGMEYGDIKALAHKFNYDPDAFYYYKSVMKAVTIFVRTKVYSNVKHYNRTLTLSHYALVMTLKEGEQVRLLTEALRQGMTVSQFRYYKTHGELPDPDAEPQRRTDYQRAQDGIASLKSLILKQDTKKAQQDLIAQWRATLDELEDEL